MAAAQPCDDFPLPENPADLSGYYSEHTVDPNYEDPADDRRRPTTRPIPTTQHRRLHRHPGRGYDPDLYAPGAGQDPAPTPPDAGDGDTGGGTGGAGGVDPNSNGGVRP